MDNQVRIFREKPFGWWDKPVIRYLREKYGKDKKTFLALRSVYLAICEMESDFESEPVYAFNKTVGTYAGLSRHAAGKYVRILEEEGLIRKIRIIDADTKLKGKGTVLQIMSSQQVETIRSRMVGYPTIRTSDHSDTLPLLKNISISKKVSINNNVTEKKRKNFKPKERDEINYYAELLAERLNDKKSLSFYKAVCARHNPPKLLQKAQAIIKDGGARNPAAVFVDWLKSQTSQQSLSN